MFYNWQPVPTVIYTTKRATWCRRVPDCHVPVHILSCALLAAWNQPEIAQVNVLRASDTFCLIIVLCWAAKQEGSMCAVCACIIKGVITNARPMRPLFWLLHGSRLKGTNKKVQALLNSTHQKRMSLELSHSPHHMSRISIGYSSSPGPSRPLHGSAETSGTTTTENWASGAFELSSVVRHPSGSRAGSTSQHSNLRHAIILGLGSSGGKTAPVSGGSPKARSTHSGLAHHSGTNQEQDDEHALIVRMGTSGVAVAAPAPTAAAPAYAVVQRQPSDELLLGSLEKTRRTPAADAAVSLAAATAKAATVFNANVVRSSRTNTLLAVLGGVSASGAPASGALLPLSLSFAGAARAAGGSCSDLESTAAAAAPPSAAASHADRQLNAATDHRVMDNAQGSPSAPVAEGTITGPSCGFSAGNVIKLQPAAAAEEAAELAVSRHTADEGTPAPDTAIGISSDAGEDIDQVQLDVDQEDTAAGDAAATVVASQTAVADMRTSGRPAQPKHSSGPAVSWHEVSIKYVPDPLTGAPALLVTQRDVSGRAEVDSTIASLLEMQLVILSQIFPRHVIEFMALQDAADDAKLGMEVGA